MSLKFRTRFPDSLDSALLDLTNELIPSYATQIQTTSSSDLEEIMSELVCQTLTKNLKDKARAKILGSMAIVISVQNKPAAKLLEHAFDKGPPT